MKRHVVNGHVIWVGTLGGDEQLDVLIKDLKKSIEKNDIHVVIFAEGEKHNEMSERITFPRVMNST